jgi:multisubunit Na+/H+ antiporter MnhB subunit
MTLFEALDLALAGIVLGVAAWTIAVREVFSAVVGYVAYGLLLAIVWVRLYAPDVALTEAAIGSGVTGVLLVTASTRLDRLPKGSAPPGVALKVAAAVLSALTAGALAAAVLYLPDPPPSLAPEADNGLPATGLGNAVTAVLIAYRSFDTMLEKVVLVLAIVGVWSVAPDRFWSGAPAPLGPAAPDAALVFLARVLAPIGIVIGVQMFWVGADEPGGAFQGGAILAAMWIIVMMARLTEPPSVGSGWLRLALISGPAVFLVVGLAGPLMAGSFFAFPAGFAKPLILLIEGFMVLSIAVTLPLLVAGPPSREAAQ